MRPSPDLGPALVIFALGGGWGIVLAVYCLRPRRGLRAGPVIVPEHDPIAEPRHSGVGSPFTLSGKEPAWTPDTRPAAS